MTESSTKVIERRGPNGERLTITEADMAVWVRGGSAAVVLGMELPEARSSVSLTVDEAEHVASHLMGEADALRRYLWREQGRCVVCGGLKDEGIEGDQCDPTGCPGV